MSMQHPQDSVTVGCNMRLFDLQEGPMERVDEVKWQYSIRLRDIFKTFQNGNLTISKARDIIVKRIEKFISDNNSLDDNAKEAFKDLSDKLDSTEDLDVLDQLIGNTLFDIADEFEILVK